MLTSGKIYGNISTEPNKWRTKFKVVKKMKCLIIDFDNSIIVIEDLLFLLHIVDIIWNENNFVIWYE